MKSPAVPLDQLAAYLNFDMVGRMQDNKLIVQAAGTSPVWARMLEQANVAAGFDLVVQSDPYQPTDVASFNQAGVPCLNFFTGTHTDYHRPSDTADKIDYEDLDRIVQFAVAIIGRLGETAEPPQFTKVEQQMTGGGGRADVRVFTGTIPDYGADAKGLLLASIRDPDPVLFLEPLRGYRQVKGEVPAGDYTVELGEASVAREGSDVTVIAWSAAVQVALQAAEDAQAQGISVEVLDLRSLVPLDVKAIAASVSKTGRAVVVQEAPLTSGFAAEVVATIQEEAFFSLQAPIRRVAAPDVPYPVQMLEEHYVPNAERVLEAIVATTRD